MVTQQWILLRDAQPEPRQQVLVFENSNRDYNAPMSDTMRVATWQGQNGFSYVDAQGTRHQALNVTHWMPLPAPPGAS